MSTIKATSITKGTYILFRGDPCLITKTEFYHPGKGPTVERVKFKNIRTGNSQDFTFKSNEQVEVADVNSREMQYLYADDTEAVFMDPRTFDQVSLPIDLVEDKLKFLTAEINVYVQSFNDQPIGVSLPPKVKLTVTEAFDAVAGGRVNAPKKPVVMETGLEVQAPLFVKEGDILVVDTQTGEYVSRG